MPTAAGKTLRHSVALWGGRFFFRLGNFGGRYSRILRYSPRWLNHPVRSSSSRSRIVAEELVAVLSSKTSYEFKPPSTFSSRSARRNAAHGGEEILHLRSSRLCRGSSPRARFGRQVDGTVPKLQGVSARTMALRRGDGSASRRSNRPPQQQHACRPSTFSSLASRALTE